MFSQVFVAGTFDGLHRGHETLLKRAFEEGERVTIGLTSDEFVRKYKVQKAPSAGSVFQSYRPYEERRKELTNWLDRKNLTVKATIIPIDDPYEPAASGNFDAIIVTAENRHRGEDINNMRLTRGLRPLMLVEVPLIPAADGAPISSTRVKSGEIDEAGRLVMPENLRAALGEPLGPVLKGKAIAKSLEKHRHHLVVTVGDVATKTVLDTQRTPALSIVDGKVGRESYHELDNFLESSGADIRRVKSGPGFISGQALKEIKDWGSEVARQVVKQRILVIDGEEDLLTLPAVAESPLGSVVYYGQPARNASASVAGGPGQGLVEVEVTSEKRKQVLELLGKFT